MKILIASASKIESTALAGVIESRGWQAVICDSIRKAERVIRRGVPRVILTRHSLPDGFSDDLIAALTKTGQAGATKIVVLMPPTIPLAIEARQIQLGADFVQRDPIRADILAAYIEHHIQFRRRATPPASTLEFASATLDPLERVLRQGNASVILTPRETTLIEVLVESANHVVTYDTLYNEVLGRPFRGDTSNMRVLLAKLANSVHQISLDLRQLVTVIPKTGYRYSRTVAGVTEK